MLCTTLLAGKLIWNTFRDYESARRELDEVGKFRVVLHAASLISGERGPSNALMGSDIDGAAEAAARLADARRLTDRGLDEVTALASPAHADAIFVSSSMMEGVRRQLASARADIDAVATLPKADRDPVAIAAATAAMFDVFDRFRVAISVVHGQLASHGSASSIVATSGHILCDLREYGGRLGSAIVPGLTAGKPLSEHARLSASMIHGRILQLWETGIGSRLALFGDDPRLADAVDLARRRFIEEGLGLVDSLIERGGKTGDYAISTGEFTRRYVETLRSLEVLRDTFLDTAIENLHRMRRKAGWMLLASTCITAFCLLILTGLLVALRFAVLAPLLGACREVIALAQDQPVTRGRYAFFVGEIRRLFAALDVLHERLEERASQTKLLAVEAETDGLTGVLNRRALDLAGMRRDARTPATACLILLDIDHFKSINDRFGHLAGDGALRQIADLLRARLGPSELLARFGGEEFAILCFGLTLGEGARLARRLRLAVQESALSNLDGTTLSVTASFGVAEGRLGASEWVSLVSRTDHALYRAKAAGRNRVRIDRNADPRSLEPDGRSGAAPNPPIVSGVTLGPALISREQASDAAA